MNLSRLFFRLPGVRGLLYRKILKQSGNRIMSGPFKGMRQSSEGVFSVWYPRILGAYERELFPVFEEIVALRPARMIDVGAAEGYLAIGFLRRLPELHMIAFEMLENGREVIGRFAKENGVYERIDIRGKADDEGLREVLSPTDEAGQILIMDVEGYEEVLLDPEKIPELKHSHVLVELHDFAVPKVTEVIRKRFEKSHQIQEIFTEDRREADLPDGLKGWPRLAWQELLEEHRPCKMSWFWMKPYK